MLHAMCKLVDKYLCIIKEMHGVTPWITLEKQNNISIIILFSWLMVYFIPVMITILYTTFLLDYTITACESVLQCSEQL